jgi:predicted RNA-binding protein YlxR (DUF448 family)
MWKLGGRTKERKIGQAVKKVLEKKPVGRAIWICDEEESIITSKLLKQIKELGILDGDAL